MTDTVATLLNTFPHVLPEIVLIGAACAVFLGGVFVSHRHLWAAVSLVAIIAAAALVVYYPPAQALGGNVFASPIAGDGLALFVRLLALAAGVVFVLLSLSELGDRQSGDFYGCLLVLLAGLSLSGMANDLVALFLALEMISIPTYVMLYIPRHDAAAQEAALKYFMLSIFSSALLLFGFSYLYGLTGSTNLAVLLHTLNGLGPEQSPPLLSLVALLMVVAGMGFRITAVPFHFYAPDVYQGTSNLMAAILAFVPKAAGFAALLRVLGFVLPEEVTAQVRIGEALSGQAHVLLWFLAAVTMTLGNVLALLQDNLRRLLAYSSIAHAGYMLIALAAAPFLREFAMQNRAAGPDGIEALLYYLVAYGAMTVGVFAVLALLHGPSRPVETVDDLAGLAKTHPGAALLMAIFLFSLIGIPFTAGFVGKFLIFFGAVGVPSGHATLFRVLAVIGVVNAAIGGWYYLRLIAVMYLRTAVKPVDRPANAPGLAAILLCALLTVGLSVPPGSTWLLRSVRQASGSVPASEMRAER